VRWVQPPPAKPFQHEACEEGERYKEHSIFHHTLCAHVEIIRPCVPENNGTLNGVC
jgi:hypothetical protein